MSVYQSDRARTAAKVVVAPCYFPFFLSTPHCTARSGQSGSGTMASMTASTVLRGAHSSIFGESLPLETTTPPKLRTTSVASGPRRGEQPAQRALVSASRMHV